MAHATELTAFRISDYPRFRESLRAIGLRSAVTSKAFRDLLQEHFDIKSVVRPQDLWGQFWLDRDQALMFVLKWS